MPLLSADRYRYWTVDHLRHEVTIVFQNGESVTEPFNEAALEDTSPVARSTFDWNSWWITLTTERDHDVTWLGFNATSDPLRPEKPIIYLDQNKWSQLASALLTPQRVKDQGEREAALELARVASQGDVILPLSSAHLLETSALHTERRYEVGIAMAALSSGWQFRHPMDVFEQEALTAVAVSYELTVDDWQSRVISTEPYTWRQSDGFGIVQPPPADIETFKEMLLAPAVSVSLLLDPEPYDRNWLPRWAEHHQRVGRQMSQVAGSHLRRRTARRRFWNENLGLYQQAVAALGLADLRLFSDSDLKAFLKTTPMISLLSELFVQRFIDRSAKWRDNDLIDMLFLSCAAGHADYVVGEARTCTQLRQIQRAQGVRESVFTKISEVVAELREPSELPRQGPSQPPQLDG